jgi:hypothetical protein
MTPCLSPAAGSQGLASACPGSTSAECHSSATAPMSDSRSRRTRKLGASGCEGGAGAAAGGAQRRQRRWWAGSLETGGSDGAAGAAAAGPAAAPSARPRPDAIIGSPVWPRVVAGAQGFVLEGVSKRWRLGRRSAGANVPRVLHLPRHRTPSHDQSSLPCLTVQLSSVQERPPQPSTPHTQRQK